MNTNDGVASREAGREEICRRVMKCLRISIEQHASATEGLRSICSGFDDNIMSVDDGDEMAGLMERFARMTRALLDDLQREGDTTQRTLLLETLTETPPPQRG